ncbi:MAG: type I restriction endonuclease subunit R [Cephaloticoccus sp.]|nr:type I restriction endonuclease subunit R [Cephaloticoccus sp.]MCF7759389.1 type I restriction endonuclease subunit R [Cephaloticoccus sp.]
MNTPNFLEAHVSQIPAIQLLQQLGFAYLSPEEVAVERRGKLGNVLLEDVLAKQLHRINRVQAKGREVPFTDTAIAEAIEKLRTVPFDGLCRTAEKIYDLIVLGVSIDQTVGDETKGRSLRFIDWEHLRNNRFHVAAEFKVARTASHETRRPDIVCFVNGIPFVVIECKRRDEKDALTAAIKQHLRNQEAAEIPHLFTYAPLLLGLNKDDGRYGTTGTTLKFWSEWKEMHGIDAEIRTLLALPPRREEHEKLFTGEFAYTRSYFEAMAAAGPREVTGQDRLLYALCRPERLIELTRLFTLFDEGGTVRKIARYQQYFAIRKALERIHIKDLEGRRRGGVIWHTQGSGKSLTMVMLAKALALDPAVPNPRIVLVTDRIDLDEQIFKTFHQCGKEPVQAKTGRHLMELLEDDRVAVITTVLDKFGAAGKANESFRNHNADLFVLVDESHRSQYGEANLRMMKALPNACFIGFTGTPLMKKEKNTAQKFGGFIEPAYTIRDAVADKAVVPLLYEGRHISQQVNRAAVDRMFEQLAEGLTTEQKADLKRKFASRDELTRIESRLYLIAWDVSEHFAKTWQGTGFKGQLTAAGKREALLIKSYLDQFGKVSSEVLISAPDDREGEGDAAADENVQTFWKAQMAKHGSEKDYNRNVIGAFKNGDTPEIIIVVDKLLTGFDAPRNVVLYIARSLKEHTLLQAIARVNRLHPGKDYGHIIDYHGVIGELHDALELYSQLAGQLFDPEDLEGALTEVREELKQLPATHDGVWDLFRDLPNKLDDEAYVLALADPLKREEFYARVSRFSRLLKIALSAMAWLNETDPAKVERYKRDALLFQKIRASVKIHYAEEIDYRDYEKQIKKMLSTYVQADEIIQVVDPVNIFERDAFQAEVDKARSPRAKADIIANRTKRTITEKMEEDPFFYRRFSLLIQQAIDDYEAQRISEADLLSRMTDFMERVRDGRHDDTPMAVRDSDLAKAFFGALKEQMPGLKAGPSSDEVQETQSPYGKITNSSDADIQLGNMLAEAACEIETIIRRHAIVRWRDNADAQNQMRNDLDDLLFRLQSEKGVKLTFEHMDAVIESILRIARNRTDV